ncbi:MAG: ribosome silencing factor [Bacteroidetes bacterium]|nr:MAG: ribosome silencing factor [Bacteroidota bacterium]TAF89603.1 MAG: ribosome silencing factor [Bacteroidota bacterium]
MATSTVHPKKSTTQKLTRNSKVFKTVLQAIENKKGSDVISIDLRKIGESVADFFIVCQAGSTTQVKAIGDEVEHLLATECGEKPYKTEGRQGLQWVIIDYVNIVVHIMHPDARAFYKLEEMWQDADVVVHTTT